MKQKRISILVIVLLALCVLIFTKEGRDTNLEHFFNDAKITIDYKAIPIDSSGQTFSTRFQDQPLLYFTTSKNLLIDGSNLPAGDYAIWIEPRTSSWKIIFSTTHKTFFSFNSISRNTKTNYLKVEVPVIPLLETSNKLTVYFKNANGFTLMYIQAGKKSVALPITLK